MELIDFKVTSVLKGVHPLLDYLKEDSAVVREMIVQAELDDGQIQHGQKTGEAKKFKDISSPTFHGLLIRQDD